MTKSYHRKWFYAGGIIRQRGSRFQVEVNRGGKRKRHTEPTLAAAKVYAQKQQLDLTNKGIAVFALTDAQRSEAADAFKELGGAPLRDAVRFYLQHHKPAGGTRTITELLAEYLTDKQNAGRRKTTLEGIKYRIGGLSKVWGGRPVHSITSDELIRWLDDRGWSGVSRANYIRAFTGFFNFAMKRGLLQVNPASKIEKVNIDETLPQIFTVAEAERIMHATQTVYPRLVPAFAIGFFAGLRSSEIEQLDWSAVDLEAKLITVRPEIAKRRRQRHVDISDNLLVWLASCKKAAGAICPPHVVVQKWRKRIVKAAPLAQWPPNGMRHSFASYHLAKGQDISKTALQLGHTRPDILFNHYRNLVKPAEAEAYWKIIPKVEEKGNVIQMPMANAG